MERKPVKPGQKRRRRQHVSMFSIQLTGAGCVRFPPRVALCIWFYRIFFIFHSPSSNMEVWPAARSTFKNSGHV